jgi:hypothetical protein
MKQKYRFVTKEAEAATKELVAELEITTDGVTLVADGYYIVTLTHKGKLMLHTSIHSDAIKTDDEGAILTSREK